jgi:excisionase family DNA binding protein
MSNGISAIRSAAHSGKLLLSVREAAKALAVCERTLWGMTQRGEIPCVRIGARKLYSVEMLRQWINYQLTRQEAACPLTAVSNDQLTRQQAVCTEAIADDSR